jgi:hypothetical protein
VYVYVVTLGEAKKVPKLVTTKKRNLIFVLALLAISLLSPQYTGCETPLAPPTIFQKPLSEEASRTGDFKYATPQDAKFITVIYSIGAHVLEDGLPVRKVEQVINFQFNNDEEFLRGLDLKGVKRKEGVVLIPYSRSGKSYTVRVSSKNGTSFQNPRTPQDRFHITISEP